MSDEKRYNRFRRFVISSQDFSVANSAAIFLLEELDETKRYPLADIRRLKCFETALIVAYARPFSMAKGTVGPLNEKEVDLKPSDPFWGLHSRILKLRNTLYGHSDAEFAKYSVIYSEETRPDAPLFLPRFPEGLSLSYLEISDIRNQIRTYIHTIGWKAYPMAIEFKDRLLPPSDDIKKPA